MTRLSAEEAAGRAGVSTDRLATLVDLGILAPGDGQFTEGDVRRVMLVGSLEDSGIQLEGLAAVLSGGELSLDFMDIGAYHRFSALCPLTFEQLSARLGVPVDLLMVVREASGAAVPTPQDRLRESELAVLPMLQLAVADSVRPESVERLLRAVGEGLRRITASESDYWRDEVLMPRLAQGRSVDEVLADYWRAERLPPRADAGPGVDEASGPEYTTRSHEAEQALLALYHLHQAHSWTRNIVDSFEQALIQAGLFTPPPHPPAMCFLDITGYTRLTEERGDSAAADLATRLGQIVERTVLRHGGRTVKWLGDGVMLWFRRPGPGVEAALDMVDRVAAGGLPPAHVGLHAGPVILQDGDYYGQTVNLASRIAEYALPGQVVVSQSVVEASSDLDLAFTGLGEVQLKGVGLPLQLFAADRRRGGDAVTPAAPA